MTRDEIIRMAREAGFTNPERFETNDGNLRGILEDFWVNLERFAALVATAERKRLHDKFMDIHKSQQHSNNYWHFAARKIAEET